MLPLKQTVLKPFEFSVAKLIWHYRRATWRKRVLPDFIIVGAMKCGTSSLHAYLAQHPQLLPSYERKEIHFFDGGIDPGIDNYTKGQAWYRAHFPLKKTVSSNFKTFEASPLYLFNPLVPKRIFYLAPETKIIAILRNPTERAISHYFHEKRKGREKLPIMKAFQEEENRLESIIKNQDYKNNAFMHCSYKSRGLYKQQIERFLSYFPRKQILVLNSEELFNEPNHSLKKVFEFVGVDTEFEIGDLKARHVAENKTDVDPEVHTYLNNYFQHHNQALYDLIGESYGW